MAVTARFAEPQGTPEEYLRRLVVNLRDVPFLQGKVVTVEDISAAGEVVVYHGLGSVPEGWFPVRVVRPAATTDAIDLYERTGTAPTKTTLTLYSTDDIDELQLWVW